VISLQDRTAAMEIFKNYFAEHFNK
jgi:hypothetical protein